MEEEKKFCKHCGEMIFKDAVMCPKCGRQVEEISSRANTGNIVINNSSSAAANAVADGVNFGRRCSKWISFCLCLFLGFVGGHKFYEGKIGTGILYILTGGLFFIGWIIDILIILCKPNPYYV